MDFNVHCTFTGGPRALAKMDKSLVSREYQAFLRLLRDTRLERGISQEQIAQRMRQTQSFVSKCERGERRIDVAELREFCIALGVPISEFVTRLEDLINRGERKS